jgi:hypothetical protein
MDTPDVIKQMVYLSKARPGLARGDVEQILEIAREKNQALDITGFLLFNGKTFVQLLEGPPENVTRLYGQIEHDNRHTQTRILLEHRTTSRLLSSWSMAYSYTEGPDSGIFGGTMDRTSVREMATILKTGDSVLRESIANTLLHLAGLDKYNAQSFFAA